MIFSIITVTRDNLAGLKRTHESISSQTFGNYEWIVVDGASTDGTGGHLVNSSANWISEPDRGIYDAMNKGIERARGRWLIFMNAGDCFAASGTLQALSEFIADQAVEPAFIYGDALEETEDGMVLKPTRSTKYILYGMFTHHQAMLYRRDVIGDLRYDLKYPIAADYKFTTQFLAQNGNAAKFSRPVCLFERQGISQRQPSQGRREQFTIRNELKSCTLLLNAGVFGIQSLALLLKRSCPGLYWGLRQALAKAQHRPC